MTETARSADRRLLAGFAALSLLAIVSGVATMVMLGTPMLRWIPNLAAWALGGGAALAIVRTTPGSRAWLAIAGAGALMIAATLAGPAQMGVHRWLAIGPLSITVAALVLPAVIVALARLGQAHRAPAIIATAIAAILALQPDASQAIALALASLAWLLPARSASSWTATASIGGLAGLALVQPDPLLPVAEVEQIIGMAASVHPALAALAVASLAALPLLVWRNRPDDTAARALALYIAAISAAPLLGWFPVPLVGAAMSFPLGLWLGIALLATPLRQQHQPT
jgi:cell division protein FtsW (lipid II flippase)